MAGTPSTPLAFSTSLTPPLLYLVADFCQFTNLSSHFSMSLDLYSFEAYTISDAYTFYLNSLKNFTLGAKYLYLQTLLILNSLHSVW